MSETTWRLAPAEATEEMAVRAFQTVDLALAAVEMGPCDQYRYAYRASLSAAPKPPTGLYEVREDGSARRVEVDVVGALRAAERALLSPAPMEDQVIARLGTGQSAIEQVRAALAHLTGNNR